MKNEVEYLIIPIADSETEIIEELNKAVIANKRSVYCCSINLFCKLLQTDSLPIKNKRIAINNILEFLKWCDVNLGQNSKLPKTCLPIGRDIFERFFTRAKYNQYLDLLKELKVMSLVSYKDGTFYIKGKKNNLFRFHNSYVGGETAIIILNNNCYGSMSIEGTHNKKMIDTIKSIEVDYKSAIMAEIDNYKKKKVDANQLRIRLNKLLSLNGTRFIKYGRKVNRVYTSLSNLSKISREYLHVNGTKFNNIDIVNCQPLLLCYYLIKINLPIDVNYIEDCQAGCFYERFYETTGKDDIDKERRKKTKQQLYESIYFDFKPDYSHNKRFCDLYPHTYQAVKQIALEAEILENTLASKLQNAEAEIFNDLLPVHSNYYFTLFDAIYFTDIADLLPLMNEIKRKFLNLNLRASMAINKCGEDEFFEQHKGG